MERKKIWKKAGNVLFIAVLLLLLFNGTAKSWMLQRLMDLGLFQANIKEEPAATAAPAFSYLDANGTIVSTGALKGKVVFINFWATWCLPCKAEMPSLHALYQQFKNDERVVFLFLSEDDALGTAKTYLKAKQLDMPVTARSGNIAREIFSGTLPTTLILDKAGRMVYRHEGVARYDAPAFIEQLRALL